MEGGSGDKGPLHIFVHWLHDSVGVSDSGVHAGRGGVRCLDCNEWNSRFVGACDLCVLGHGVDGWAGDVCVGGWVLGA